MGAPLLCFGADLLSHEDASYAPSGYASIGAASTRWPITNLNDGQLGSFAKIEAGTAAFGLDALRPIQPALAVLGNNNFDLATSIKLQAADTADFSVVAFEVDLTSVWQRTLWVDLRDLLTSSHEFWRAYVSGHTGTPTLGELILATPANDCGDILWGFKDTTGYVRREIATTPLNARHRRSYGAITRRRDLRAAGPISRVEPWLLALYAARSSRWPWVFVPNEDEADVFVLDPTGPVQKTLVLANWREVSVTVNAQGEGVLE